MIKNHLTILGSQLFSNILDEIEFSKINFNKHLNYSDRNFLIKIIFAENLDIKEVKSHLSKNEPLIFFVKNKGYIKKNNLNLLGLHVCLQLPIDILSFKEILNILITKYIFLQKSKIVIKDYKIDCNQKSITKKKLSAKLTEKELELILALNKRNGLDKSSLLKSIWKHSNDLETHTFETHLHRLRKKIKKYFKDENFIFEKDSLYFLVK